jgi:hypothetical protein
MDVICGTYCRSSVRVYDEWSTVLDIRGRLESVHPSKGSLRESSGLTTGWLSGTVIIFKD